MEQLVGNGSPPVLRPVRFIRQGVLERMRSKCAKSHSGASEEGSQASKRRGSFVGHDEASFAVTNPSQPWVFPTAVLHKIIQISYTIPMIFRNSQKGPCNKRGFLKSFMTIIVFSQSHRLKSTTQQIAYDSVPHELRDRTVLINELIRLTFARAPGTLFILLFRVKTFKDPPPTGFFVQ